MLVRFQLAPQIHLTPSAVGRFHQDEAITATTAAPAVHSDSEKADAYTSESPVPETKPVHMMDEEFEWREVIRGMSIPRIVRLASSGEIGLTDFQAWVTGIAYLGLIVC